MKFKTRVLSFVGIFLFLAGIVLAMAVSGGVLWGEIETRLYTPQASGLDLALQCPLILSVAETGTVSALIRNPLDEAVKPMVIANFSRRGGTQEFSETLTLAPHESKTMTWNADAANMVFGRLILVSVLQQMYRELPARQGYCGILFLNFAGLNGIQILTLLCSVSLFLLILGGASWLRVHVPMNAHAETVARAFGSLAVLVALGLVAALLRWWGLTMVLDGIALMLIGVIFTEVLFNPR